MTTFDEHATAVPAPAPGTSEAAGTSRRRFLGYLVAGPTLVAAAQMSPFGGVAHAAIPSGPQFADIVDLNDLLTNATIPTANLITVTINADGTASFAMPRVESGQGIATSTAMMIAEELDLPVDKVVVTLADARPELLFNQFTAGSNTTISTFTPFRVAAATARMALLEAAAIQFGDSIDNLSTKNGAVLNASGGQILYGDLAAAAATRTTRAVTTALKNPQDYTVIGTPVRRTDALAAVTGKKKYAMDLVVPDALPTMVAHPPTIKATPLSVANLAAVKAMPGVTDVVQIATGVAVRARTFGQCVDAIRALQISWSAGSVDSESDATILAKLRAAEIPLAIPAVPLLAKTVEAEFVYNWKSNGAMEPQTVIADVRSDRAEIWSSMQSPILTQQQVAAQLGLPEAAVTAHVITGGGAFGRRMFSDVVLQAAEISQKIGKPVKLMWHRTDECRVGRTHPMATSRIRATYMANNVLTFEQRHTSVATDYTQGFGEAILAAGATTPPMGQGNELGFSQSVWNSTVHVPYNVGVVTQVLDEIFEFDDFPTGSNRNLYNPDAVTSIELMIDQLAKAMRRDPLALRLELVKDDRARAVLVKAAEAGNWGRTMAPGTAQGIALHTEYKGATACLVEVDNRATTVNRPIVQGVTGPRVTKVTFVIDAGLAINPLGLQAQMQGGIMDAIGQVFTESLHLKNGAFAEGSWDDYHYTRQWNTPFETNVIVMPPTTGEPGGAGEFGVSAAKAAMACAYARATGTLPTSFPINHNADLTFAVKPFVPPVPQSPTNGRQLAR